MPDPRLVISNTSPLFYLHRIHAVDLLRQLYTRVNVTKQVLAELAAGGVSITSLGSSDWLTTCEIQIPDTLKTVPDLGAGEASAIALALESSLSPLLLLDDRLGRRIAALNHLAMTGTAGILLRAKQQGLVPAIKPLLGKLIQSGFYLRPQHIADICSLAGE